MTSFIIDPVMAFYVQFHQNESDASIHFLAEYYFPSLGSMPNDVTNPIPQALLRPWDEFRHLRFVQQVWKDMCLYFKEKSILLKGTATMAACVIDRFTNSFFTSLPADGTNGVD